MDARFAPARKLNSYKLCTPLTPSKCPSSQPADDTLRARSPADEVLLVAGLAPAAQDAVHTVVPHGRLGGGGVAGALLLWRIIREVWEAPSVCVNA